MSCKHFEDPVHISTNPIGTLPKRYHARKAPRFFFKWARTRLFGEKVCRAGRAQGEQRRVCLQGDL